MHSQGIRTHILRHNFYYRIDSWINRSDVAQDDVTRASFHVVVSAIQNCISDELDALYIDWIFNACQVPEHNFPETLIYDWKKDLLRTLSSVEDAISVGTMRYIYLKEEEKNKTRSFTIFNDKKTYVFVTYYKSVLVTEITKTDRNI